MGPAAKVKTPPDAQVIDLTGKTIIPGIINAHSHISDDPALKLRHFAQFGVTSTIGMVEVVPVRLQQSQATPLASGYWPLQAQAIADGYVVVPAESEGFAEGAAVAVRMVV